jgi:HD-GYP domain-containing protein (c-di-GMP phosphodiesterase class II)
MVTPRSYRKAFSGEFVLKYIAEQSGILFDPDIVPVFISMQGGIY